MWSGLLLLPIFLFDNFTITPDSIIFNLQGDYEPYYLKILLKILNYTTGHFFYIKKVQNEKKIQLFCLGSPHFFYQLFYKNQNRKKIIEFDLMENLINEQNNQQL